MTDIRTRAEIPPDFPVEFEQPTDADEVWERDAMHLPFALTPLAADATKLILGRSFNRYYEHFGVPQRQECGIWHGWAYFSFRPNRPEAERKAAGEAFSQVARERIPLSAAYWRDEAMPRLLAIYRQIEEVDPEGLPSESLAAAWLEAWEAALEAWKIHFISILAPYQVLEDLSDLYAAALGPGRDVEALGLVGGGQHELEEVEQGIERLAALAAEPGLAAALDAARATPLGEDPDDPDPLDLDGLRALPGGPELVAELSAFLGRHGHLGQNHDDFRLASWGENPRLLLNQVLLRLRKPAQPSAERSAEQARRAAELEAGARTKLADRPDELARFDTVLAQAREIGYLTEGHNYWIDRMSQARVRSLAIRTGRRLVRDGVLDRAGDVFFLTRDEVAAAILDGEPRQRLIEHRREVHAANERLAAPRYVGMVPPVSEQGPGDRFDSPTVAFTSTDELNGVGASPGLVRGPARVVLDQDGFDRIQPGDIIVCPSSNPSWVPVFTIAGGLVTNTGGVLSHAAVVAREFGLPAVVGAAEATTRIPDGRMLEVDGTAGTVRLL